MKQPNKLQQRLASAGLMVGITAAAVAGFNHLNTINSGSSQVFGANDGVRQYCYLLADIHKKGGEEMIEDIITKYDFTTGKEAYLSGDQMNFIGTKNAEALEFDYKTQKLYVVEQSRLWTVDLNTGVGQAKPSKFGNMRGEYGVLEAKKVNSLAQNPRTGDFFAVNRDTQRSDQLFVVDVETGLVVKDYFGDGKDYITINEPEPIREIDDLAFDLTTNQLYGLSGTHGRQGILTDIVKIDLNTGQSTLLGNTGLLDVEGMSFNPNGKLYISTGNWGEPKDHLYEVNTSTGQAKLDTAISLPLASDYEGLDCLISEPVATSSSSLSSLSSSQSSSVETSQDNSQSSSAASLSSEQSSSSVSSVSQSSGSVDNSSSVSSTSSINPVIAGDGEDVDSPTNTVSSASTQSKPAGQVLGDSSSLVRSGGGAAVAGLGVFGLLSVYLFKLKKGGKKITNDTGNLKA